MRVVGCSSASTVSPNKVDGDSRASICAVMTSVASSPLGTSACAIAGASAGQITVRNSQRPSVASAAVAAERKTIENNMASASHTPA